MHFRKTVAFGEQVENAARVGDETPFTQRLRIGGCGLCVAQQKHRQALMRFVERIDHRFARTLERHALHIEARDTLGIAGKQSFDGRAIGTDESFAGIAGIGKSGFEQQKKITVHRVAHLSGT